MSDLAYPLHWPAGWPRCPSPGSNTRFGAKTVHAAVNELLAELGRIKATNAIISSNVSLQGAQPKDKGVCAYFTLRGKNYALPCDKWNCVEDNLIALSKHIESLRGQERWGVGTVERAFAGYLALGNGERTWREVFGFSANQRPTPQEFADRYRDLALRCHPDHGGSGDRMAELNRARSTARTEGIT